MLRNPLSVTSTTSISDGKCGFWLTAQIAARWRELSHTEQTRITELLMPVLTQKDTVVGMFHIHYDTSGIHTPALLDNNNQPIPGTAKAFVDSAARIFNSVWRAEIDSMGYLAPQFEIGDTSYNVYIRELGSSLYGQTVFVSEINAGETPPRSRTYIEIDNDFKDFYSKGIKALEVTAAHEFHHAIQLGSYGLWDNDIYFYEITSTWLEDVLFTQVNDYYQYLPAYFESFQMGKSFYDNTRGTGYERSIWAHFLAKRFGTTVMRDIWSSMRATPFIPSARRTLGSYGTNLAAEYAMFTYWNYFTADRADTVRFYPEGRNYPRLVTSLTTPFNGSTASISNAAYSMSTSAFEFRIGADTVTAMIANIDIDAAERYDNTSQSLDVKLTSGIPGTPYQVLGNGLKIGFTVSDRTKWESFFLEASTKSSLPRKEVSPNPARLSETSSVSLPVNESVNTPAEVLFFSSSLDLAYSGQYAVTEYFGSRILSIPSSDLRPRLSSGIYFVIARVAEAEYRWKVVVIQ